MGEVGGCWPNSDRGASATHYQKVKWKEREGVGPTPTERRAGANDGEIAHFTPTAGD
jgi:hypothetical protein